MDSQSSVNPPSDQSRPKGAKSLGRIIQLNEDAVKEAGLNAEDRLRLVRALMSLWGMKGEVVLGWQSTPAEMTEQRVISLLNSVGATSRIQPIGQTSASNMRRDAGPPDKPRPTQAVHKARGSKTPASRQPRDAPRTSTSTKRARPEFISDEVGREFGLMQLELDKVKTTIRSLKLEGKEAPSDLLAKKEQIQGAIATFQQDRSKFKQAPKPTRLSNVPIGNSKGTFGHTSVQKSSVQSEVIQTTDAGSHGDDVAMLGLSS